MKQRQIDKKTRQIRIDSDLHYFLKIKATKFGYSLKDFIEELIETALEKLKIKN